MLKGYTHICIHPIEDDAETGTERICHEPLALTRPHGTWVQTGAQRHIEREHREAPAAVQSTERKEVRAKDKVKLQLLVDNPLTPQQITLSASFTLTKVQADLSAQASWYVYATMHISKAAFDDVYYQAMLTTRLGLHACWRASSSNFGCELSLKSSSCLSASCSSSRITKPRGNPYAQFLHDGGTLSSHKKYQAFAMQFTSPDWDQNFVICFDFSRSKHNKDVEVAELSKIEFKNVTGYDFAAIFGTTIADRAARGVGVALDHESEVCSMHDGDKLGQSASGALTRSKNHVIINPFPECVKLMSNARKMGTDFTWDWHTEKLWAAGVEAMGAAAIPHIPFEFKLTSTARASLPSTACYCQRSTSTTP